MNEINVLYLLNICKDSNFELTKEVILFLNQNNCNVYLDKNLYDNLVNEYNFVKLYSSKVEISFALLAGGDGTFINELHKYQDCDFPFFGINLGRVGCLCEANIKNFKDKILQILDGNYIIEKRNVINYCVKLSDLRNISGISFNEVTIERAKLFKILRFNLYVNDLNKTTFYADGVIISTTTGSSAYNLSSGGPLLLPTSNNFVVTPICPQLRTISSLVLNDDCEIKIDLKDNNINSYENKPIICIDGKNEIELDEESTITITRSNKIFKLIKVNKDESLYEATYKVAMSSKNLYNN